MDENLRTFEKQVKFTLTDTKTISKYNKMYEYNTALTGLVQTRLCHSEKPKESYINRM